MKKLLLVAVFLFTAFIRQGFAQNCFEIQSILVDACGTPEGENEMASFTVGSNPLNVSTLNVIWPNGAWLGVCSNVQTATVVDALNTTIQGCGIILEPTGNILPANSKVVLVTSTNMNPSANSFAGLTDTLYMIFQCSGNTAGHFKNYSAGSGTRTLIMQFGACSDTVTYVVDSLTDQSGLHAAQDGATVSFDAAGNDSYSNQGCQAPVNQLSATVTASATQLCPGDIIQLQAVISTTQYTSLFWGGGTGFFSTQTLNTTYASPSSATGTEYLYVGVVGNCGDTIYDSLAITFQTGANASITASGPVIICNGDSVILTASGGSQFLWSTGATTASITVTTSGNYIVTVTGGCSIDTASQAVSIGSLVNAVITANGPTTICTGDSVTLTASGGTQYLWSTGATSPAITVTSGALYIVTVTSNCGSDTASQQINTSLLPIVSIIPSGPLSFCQGDSVLLIAQGSGNYLWSTGATNDTITVFTSGNYTVTVSSNCGNATANEIVVTTPLPSAVLSSSGTTLLCNGSTLTLSVTGAGNYNWSTGSTASSITVSSSGNYVVTASNSCGVDADSVIIITDSVIASAIASPVTGNAPLSVNFTNQSTNGENYYWFFTANDTSQAENPSFTFQTAGVYPVQLIAESTLGCLDTFHLSIEVIFDAGLYIPNIFTPNADNMNDSFFVAGSNIAALEGTIYNRWGAEVSTITLSKGWDGNYDNGTAALEGTYYYVMNITLKNGELQERNGTVTLSR